MNETTLPEYWLDHLKEKIELIHRHQTDAYLNCSSAAMITDIHWDVNNHLSAQLMERVLTECSIPYFFNGGDIVSGKGICPPELIINDIVEYRRSFRAIEDRCLMVEGNHDTAYSTFKAPVYYAENLSIAEFYEYYFRFMTLYPGRHFGPDRTYYYADNEVTKTRYIVLNTHDIPTDATHPDHKPLYNKFDCYGIRQKQAEWLGKTALNVPDKDWNVFLCTHEPPTVSSGDDSVIICNFRAIADIVNLFRKHKKGKVAEHNSRHPEYDIDLDLDFEERGGNFICWITGHEHIDAIGELEGVKYVLTEIGRAHV